MYMDTIQKSFVSFYCIQNERKDLALPVSKNGVVHIKDFQRKMAADTIPAFKEVILKYALL